MRNWKPIPELAWLTRNVSFIGSHAARGNGKQQEIEKVNPSLASKLTHIFGITKNTSSLLVNVIAFLTTQMNLDSIWSH